jgi:hypothetical protein
VEWRAVGEPAGGIQMSIIVYRAEVRTDYGVASVWKDGNQWRWTLAGNEGCGAVSFLAALAEAEEAAASVAAVESKSI